MEKNYYIETSYLSNKMLYNSLLFCKIESSIGVDKWVKVLDIQEKPLYIFPQNVLKKEHVIK
jgi:hypothetical protein